MKLSINVTKDEVERYGWLSGFAQELDLTKYRHEYEFVSGNKKLKGMCHFCDDYLSAKLLESYYGKTHNVSVYKDNSGTGHGDFVVIVQNKKRGKIK